MGTTELLKEFSSNNDYTVTDIKNYRFLMLVLHLGGTDTDINYDPIIVPVSLFRQSTTARWHSRALWNSTTPHIISMIYKTDTLVTLNLSGTTASVVGRLYGIK